MYYEMVDWLDDNIITDADRVGYEEEWPYPVEAELQPDGSVVVK